MQDVTNEAFASLFKEAFQKCFGYVLHKTLSETECKHFSNQIFDATGLVIGAKSLKNYSLYVLTENASKPENPSIATLDTLARYVVNAPYTDEVARKEKKSHFPYWFQYRNEYASQQTTQIGSKETGSGRQSISLGKRRLLLVGLVVIILFSALSWYLFSLKKNEGFTENFQKVTEDSLLANGWFVQAKDSAWWNKRNELPNHLTLFTLPGDNWSDSVHNPSISNLLLHTISADCFTAEIHLDDFVPFHRWQQAGILLLSDTNFKSKSLRLSIAYNDFFGGFNKPREIILQGIVSDDNDARHPEEMIHLPLFNIENGQDSLVAHNLVRSALRIERRGTHYRFLYATGQVDNFAFKEALSKDLDFKPKYLGIFALQGFVNDSVYQPVYIKQVGFTPDNCTE